MTEAEVTVQTGWDIYTTTTGADGRFTLPDVPALDGDLLVAASAFVNGERFTGSAPETAPEPGGTTDIGYFYICGASTQRRTAEEPVGVEERRFGPDESFSPSESSRGSVQVLSASAERFPRPPSPVRVQRALLGLDRLCPVSPSKFRPG